ncbi:Bis(5'-nucleosyl)-tetraphosphatase PrpE [asymmetrical] [compost metagenome]
MQNQFVQKLYDAPLDIIGDIHGEIDALKELLRFLGYGENGDHVAHRKLVFVGDLCDRGLDSIAVMQLVKHLVENGNAQCVLGNHELNLLIGSKREGNGWFFGSPHEDNDKNFNSKNASLEDKNMIIEFLSTLPLALESEKLRVVHACWDQASIDALKQNRSKSIKKAYDQFVKMNKKYLEESELEEKVKQEKLHYHVQLNDVSTKVPFLKYLAQQNILEQMNNPIKVITSGAEKLAEQVFYAGGKWRMVDRIAWWDYYQDDVPVVVGHYWRNFKTTKEKTGFFEYIDAVQWFGLKKNVFCIDYSVGKRYLDRHHQKDFSNRLAALRFPENVLLLDNGAELKLKY